MTSRERRRAVALRQFKVIVGILLVSAVVLMIVQTRMDGLAWLDVAVAGLVMALACCVAWLILFSSSRSRDEKD